jgi:hypothetical protein
MNIRKFWLLTAVVCLSMILVFSVTGCRGEVTSKEAAKEGTPGEEKPDKELFNKYFSHVSLGVRTFLPHQEGWLTFGFNNKKDFTFRTEVFNLEANNFIKRCASTASSDGADGGGMEVLEWAFLSPGNYEYRIYVEDTLVAILPFEVISYVDYFFGK